MRTIGAASLFLCVMVCLLRPALAAERCTGADNKLGVARTATIDTTKGLHLGSQYKSDKAHPLLHDGEVVLTFDDGPSRLYTHQILDALEAQCTKATFFMVGRMALADPAMVKEVARRGHTVATHTWSHANLQKLADDKAEVEIELGLSAVQQALAKPVSSLFRFPYLRETDFTRDHLRSRQIAAVGIDIDSRDFEIKDADALYEGVMRAVTARHKGIILFHDIHPSTAHAVPKVLAELKARGFKVVHLVSKAGAETIAQYDALARQESERKVATRSPLPKHTVALPVTATPDAKTPPKTEIPAPLAPPVPAAPGEEDWTADIWGQSN